MKIRSGHIPTDLTYIFGPDRDIPKVSWDDVEREETEVVENIKVTPAFVAQSDNEKSLETGRAWAKNTCTRYDHKTGQYVTTGVVQEIHRENTPISGLVVLGMDFRGNGGRAYKVMTPDGYYFDLREDILLDTMRSVGIQPGGVLNGEYVWARIAAEMKLVRVGSEIYSALIDAGERGILSHLPKDKLVPGGIYLNKAGEELLFLGFVATTELKLKWPNGHSTWENVRDMENGKIISAPVVEAKRSRRHALWMSAFGKWEAGRKQAPTLGAQLLFSLAAPELSHHFNVTSTFPVVKFKGKISEAIPADFIEQIRLKAVDAYKTRQAENARRQAQYKAQAQTHHYWNRKQNPNVKQYDEEEGVCSASKMCLIHLPGTPEPTVDDTAFTTILGSIGKTIT